MNQEKFGNFIKDIRKKNNLTQKQFADKYNVTYQAVSKWENGKNMPDTALIKQISEDFNVSLEELFDGEYKSLKKHNKNLITIISSVVIIIILLLIIIFIIKNEDDFKFKTLSSSCDKFNISGNVAYNDSKSAIYITNIKYCGSDEAEIEEYKKIECILYETNNDIEKKISSYSYDKNQTINLENFLETVTFSVDDYSRTCKEYSENSLYLFINATDMYDKVTSYKIPLLLDKSCSN